MRNGTTNVVVDYRISICSALSQPIESPCQHDAAVCRRTNHTDAVLLGHLSDRVISIDRATGALRLLLKGGATCPGDRTQTLQTQINFECGKTLVSVVFVGFFFFRITICMPVHWHRLVCRQYSMFYSWTCFKNLGDVLASDKTVCKDSIWFTIHFLSFCLITGTDFSEKL